MDKVTFSQKQVEEMRYLLNNITTTGINNATQISVIAQILRAGKIENEKKEGGS